jgi:phage tail-like protein
MAAFEASASASASFSASAEVSIGGARSAKASSKPDAKHTPLVPFRFELRFMEAGQSFAMCQGAFAECSGLEATMEPKAIRAGGVARGMVQRAGPVSYATVILRRGVTPTQQLWRWFDAVSGGQYARRLDVEIDVQGPDGEKRLGWRLVRCLPVKFKAADLNAQAGEVAVEELHLVHEGLSLVYPKA